MSSSLRVLKSIWILPFLSALVVYPVMDALKFRLLPPPYLSLIHILRNDPQWQDKIIYWGPMGCLTGNYLLMKGDLKPQDILALMQDTFRFVAEYEGEVPGAAPQDCGNYLLHDLPMAKWESAKYLHEVLEQMKEENMKYPEKEEK